MHKRILPLTIALLTATSSWLQADILAQWDFASNGNATTTHTDVASASAVTRAGGTFANGGHSSGTGINLDGSSYTNDEPIHDIENGDWTGDSGRFYARNFNDTSITSDTKHFAFNVELDAGKSYNLDNVWFDFGIREVSGNQISVQMSPNSDFSNPIVLGEGEDTSTANDALGYFDDNGIPSIGMSNEQSGSSPSTGNKNFSWNRLENTLNTPVAISGTTYFRIYVAGGENDNDPAANNYIDNLTVETSVIPEPGTLALVGITLGTLLFFRRRK